MKRKLDNFFANPPVSLAKPESTWRFGTAGYRGNSNVLLQTLTRASLLALIRSSTFCGKVVGIMLTASHNKKEDNGIKIIDHNGDYIDKNMELLCDEIVNSKELYKTICKIHRKLGNMRDFGCASQPVIAIGRDTRASGEFFANEIKKVLEICGGRVIDYGIVTTPELHYIVRNSNLEGRTLSQNEYVNHIVKWYKTLLSLTQLPTFDVYVDCANGVGGLVIDRMSKMIPEKRITIINAQAAGTCQTKKPTKNKNQISNNESGQETQNQKDLEKPSENKTKGKKNVSSYLPCNELLNYKCGADYVVTNSLPPENITVDCQSINRCASFDGDADRLVYFTCKPSFKLVNGDKTAIFLAHKIAKLAKGLDTTIGVVLSHYSNSAAILSLPKSVKYVLSDTGVKNFIRHSRTFDIGIFFEPNGHGSVTFSERFLLMLKQKMDEKNHVKSDINSDKCERNNKESRTSKNKFKPDPINDSNIDIKNNTKLKEPRSPGQKLEFIRIADDEKREKMEKLTEKTQQARNIETLYTMSKLFDPCVGDAIANFLVLEALFQQDSLDEFIRLYDDLPTRMLSVKIKRKEIIKMASDIEIIEPKELKIEVQKLCNKFNGRSFVRPSGTENLVRVFAEAESQTNCDMLCVNIAQAVYDICQGTGSHPEIKY